jgi:predicted nucleotidyltransferase
MILEESLEKIPASFREDCEKIVNKLQDGLGERLVSVLLYGSIARREVTGHSDLDIYVIARGLPENPLDRAIFLKSFLSGFKTGRRVSIRGKTPEEFAGEILPLYLDLATDAVILQDRESFSARVLERIRGKIKEVGLIRYRTPHGYLGWKLNRPLEKGERIVI